MILIFLALIKRWINKREIKYFISFLKISLTIVFYYVTLQ